MPHVPSFKHRAGFVVVFLLAIVENGASPGGWAPLALGAKAPSMSFVASLLTPNNISLGLINWPKLPKGFPKESRRGEGGRGHSNK